MENERGLKQDHITQFLKKHVGPFVYNRQDIERLKKKPEVPYPFVVERPQLQFSDPRGSLYYLSVESSSAIQYAFSGSSQLDRQPKIPEEHYTQLADNYPQLQEAFSSDIVPIIKHAITIKDDSKPDYRTPVYSPYKFRDKHEEILVYPIGLFSIDTFLEVMYPNQGKWYSFNYHEHAAKHPDMSVNIQMWLNGIVVFPFFLNASVNLGEIK